MDNQTSTFYVAVTATLAVIIGMAFLSCSIYTRITKSESEATPVTREMLEKCVRQDSSIICGMVLFKETGSSKEAECILFGRDAGKSDIRQLYDDVDEITLIPGGMMQAPAYTFFLERMGNNPDDKTPTNHGWQTDGGFDPHILDYETETGQDSISARQCFLLSSGHYIKQIAYGNPEMQGGFIFAFGDYFGDSLAQYIPNYRYGDGRVFGQIAGGHGLMLSPKQILSFYDAIANGGIRPRERYLRPRRICSEATAETLRQLLIDNVLEGTGRMLRDCTVPVAGKPGFGKYDRGHLPGRRTVQGKDEYRVSSFVGFFPAKTPRYTMLVSLYGSSTVMNSQVMNLYKDIVEEMCNNELIW